MPGYDEKLIRNDVNVFCGHVQPILSQNKLSYLQTANEF